MMCTHCQHSTEWRPTVQDLREHLGQSINGFVMNSFAYVQQVSQLWREQVKKLNYGTNSYIEINERRCTSWQNYLKMWSIYWIMSISQCDQESIHYCHIEAHERTVNPLRQNFEILLKQIFTCCANCKNIKRTSLCSESAQTQYTAHVIVINQSSKTTALSLHWQKIVPFCYFQSELGLSPEGQYGRFADGRLTCHFYRYINPSFISPNSTELDKVVNLTDQFYILMAKGPLSRLSKIL